MGLQFGISFWLSDEVNQFTAVGRNEMAGRSGQVRSLLDSCLFLSTTFIVFDWIPSQFLSAGTKIDCRCEGRGKLRKLYSTEYHFSVVVRKSDLLLVIDRKSTRLNS